MVCNHISLPEGRTDSYLFSSTLSSSCCLNVCEYKSVHFWWPVCCLTFDGPNPVLPVASTPSRWCLASKWHQNRCFYFNNLRGTFCVSFISLIQQWYCLLPLDGVQTPPRPDFSRFQNLHCLFRTCSNLLPYCLKIYCFHSNLLKLRIRTLFTSLPAYMTSWRLTAWRSISAKT